MSEATLSNEGVAPDRNDWDDLLATAIAGRGLRSVFQPIVDLHRCVVAGYEALTRFDIGPGVGPDTWFGEAASRGIGPELEAAALRSAFAHRPDLPANTFLTLNVEPESLFSPLVMDVLRDQGDLTGLVIEITEHRPIPDPQRLVGVLDRLRSEGALIAVDDAGSGYAGLQQILMLRPSILKLDRALVEGVDRDEAKAALIEMIGLFANRIDAWLLAEGIETAAEARRCAALGVPLVQGYFFARPAPPWAMVNDEATVQLLDLLEGDRGATLRELLTVIPTVTQGELAGARSDTRRLAMLGARFDSVAAGHLVVVDHDQRPLGLLTPDGLLDGELTSTLRANLQTSPNELAHRLSIAVDGDHVLPVLVTDNAGRYVGTVNVRRLLAALGTAAP